MSQLEKLNAKLKDLNKILKYTELKKLLRGLGYEESTKGKTSGSRVAYINKEISHIISLHKPHPGNELKRYEKQYVLTELTKMDLI